MTRHITLTIIILMGLSTLVSANDGIYPPTEIELCAGETMTWEENFTAV